MFKRLILCMDGTWNSPFISANREDGQEVLKPTNVLKVARAVLTTAPDDECKQITYYDFGVGAIGQYPGASNKLLHWTDRALGGAWGAGFEEKIEQAMTFLSNNYVVGDEIYVFGFSRGSAQARGLTRFFDWLGGVPPKNIAYYVPIFFRHYLTTRGTGKPQDIVSSKGNIPAEQVIPAQITFLGIWDTVMALGSRLDAQNNNSISSRSFHVGAKPAASVQKARHAIAIDEKRYDFRAEIWEGCGAGQDMEQRWFAGVHGSVGGSCLNDGMANCALRWILAEACACGLAVDQTLLGYYKCYPCDELVESYGMKYKIGDLMRFKKGQGIRPLLNQPESANLSLDPSVITRLNADHANHKHMNEPYRPENLIAYLAQYKDDIAGYLESIGVAEDKRVLPQDVLARILAQ